MKWVARSANTLLAIWLVACAAPPQTPGSGQLLVSTTWLKREHIHAERTPEGPLSTSGLLRFVGLETGNVLAAGRDAATGLPTANVVVEAYVSRLPIGLEADGLLVAVHTDRTGTVPERVELKWHPWHGSGHYLLSALLLDQQSGTVPSKTTIEVEVSGMPDATSTLQSRFIELYREHFGLELRAPVFARYNAPRQDGSQDSRWVSAAYVQDRLYEVSLADDGVVRTASHALGTDEGVSFCRPSGTIRMLAVVVDYGNTGLDPRDAERALRTGLLDARRRWAEYARDLDMPGPILHIELTTFLYGAPPQPGHYLTPREIRAATTLDPADFDLLAQIDLDKDNLTTGQHGGIGAWFGEGCRPSGPRETSIAFNVPDRSTLENGLPAAVFEHELTHAMGWMHWWPNQTGDALSWAHSGAGGEPYLMFGWTDADGDGVIEIYDRTPYGLVR